MPISPAPPSAGQWGSSIQTNVQEVRENGTAPPTGQRIANLLTPKRPLRHPPVKEVPFLTPIVPAKAVFATGQSGTSLA